jgi:hypothetical protein
MADIAKGKVEASLFCFDKGKKHRLPFANRFRRAEELDAVNRPMGTHRRRRTQPTISVEVRR